MPEEGAPPSPLLVTLADCVVPVRVEKEYAWMDGWIAWCVKGVAMQPAPV
jgi:hypothetical protein